MKRFSGFQVSYCRTGGKWETANLFTNSPGTVTISPTTPGVPEQIMVRVRMFKGNYPVTAYSSAPTITLNP